MNTITQITAEETYPVRHEVLRKGKPLESCRFDGDELETTVHFGLYENLELAGVVTVLENGNPVFEAERQFQVRGMAVLEQHQKKGFGDNLLTAAEDYIKGKHGRLIWFNARIGAAGFYEKAGYKKNGPAFEIPNVGPHYVMHKEVL
ncbi:GNAT family N-acetyltransferase [Flavobacterium pallidum]|uniref:GNAT family N-acetyltransferase n=1 Tax=Flavobacterium pallidum TaxID=2172098 RepID=A0A2S1SE99_9FLAO|nr:GNAT family N-acetyltransferase [Flavobacterium pallidum]AWI24677.1 GNAT family N-acetyltransferase [Flavobacterium pallidum]